MIEPPPKPAGQPAAPPPAKSTAAASAAPAAQPTTPASAQGVAQSPDTDLDKVVNRLKRIEGQVRGLQRMVAEGATCEDVLTQLAATRAALDRVGIFLITHKVRECLLDEGDTSSEAAVQRALETFQKYAQHLQALPGADQP